MADGTRDPVTGRKTTGHEWNGIEELDTPIPRVVLAFLAVTILFAIGYWLLMPAWPTGRSYTPGLLGADDRETVVRLVGDAEAARMAEWSGRILSTDFREILADEALMDHVQSTGRPLFLDNCAACHGTDATGGPGYPNLSAGAPLWGNDPAVLEQTIRVGINSGHPETRRSQMPAFGRQGMLGLEDSRAVAAHVRSLSGAPLTAADASRLASGATVFAASCAACHGADGTGNRALGAPDLTDGHWIYGGDAQSVFASVWSGRQGQMPAWEARLSPGDIRLLAAYVASLGGNGT